jgi:hypothetical protein
MQFLFMRPLPRPVVIALEITANPTCVDTNATSPAARYTPKMRSRGLPLFCPRTSQRLSGLIEGRKNSKTP